MNDDELITQGEIIFDFIEEINLFCAPVCKVTYEPDELDGSIMFDVALIKHIAIKSAVLNVSDEFILMVNHLCLKHFGKKPSYNNTCTTFWISY